MTPARSRWARSRQDIGTRKGKVSTRPPVSSVPFIESPASDPGTSAESTPVLSSSQDVAESPPA